MQCDAAESTTHGTILMTVIVVIACIILLAFLLGFFNFFKNNDSLAPPHIKIIGVNHGTKYESQVIIRSYSSEELENDLLMAKIFVNDEELLACIYTLNGHNFIPTRHYGVKFIGGSGCRGLYFSPRETIIIDLKNGYIRPGDKVTIFIYQKYDGEIYLPLPGNLLNRKYMERYLNEFVYKDIKGYRLYSEHHFNA
ncbi:hypothetical protein [Methanospirillum sp.]|uniref:hypothetical protein n=1 Tax=Methanospirillum sp. TaxID=45200 RepID=UPI002987241E|nr:hypothetical protein [Methanospirillum sp.]